MSAHLILFDLITQICWRVNLWSSLCPRAVQTGSGTHPASYPRKCGDVTPLPQYAFMAWCSVKAQGQLYLLPYFTMQSSASSCHFLPLRSKYSPQRPVLKEPG
jgi:hypothetical protein